MTSRTHTPEDVQKIIEPWRDPASDYERGFIDGMQKQMQSSVDKAVNAMSQPEPWEKFCDSNCVWTDHHPDCKLAQPKQEPVAFGIRHGFAHDTYKDAPL